MYADESEWYETGRKDADGVTWYVTDPYPTWYRRVNGEIVDAYTDPVWADEPVRITANKPDDFPVQALQSMSMGIYPQYAESYVRSVTCTGPDCPVCALFD